MSSLEIKNMDLLFYIKNRLLKDQLQCQATLQTKTQRKEISVNVS